MKNLIKKLFNSRQKNELTYISFERLKAESEVVKIFRAISKYSKNSEIRYVGGCVRKVLNKEKTDDIDLAVNLEPKTVCNILKKENIKYFESGIDHGTITAKIGNQKFEITSLRRDLIPDGRHSKVEFCESWYEDASRRDFTINSIYSDINGNLYDPFNGRQDLKNQSIKFIGDPEKRIKEDYLRILRYVRFFLNYTKLKHDLEIKKVIKKNIDGISKISSERLIEELKKIVLSKGFLNLAKDDFSIEIIQLIFPQLKNIGIFKNLDEHSISIINKKDFIFLISIMIIDETDNTDYFLYKYNLSNEEKKRVKFLHKYFSKPIDSNFFNKDNLWKVYYLNNKNYLEDLINFKIFKSKNQNTKLINLKKYFSDKTCPRFPIKAETLMNNYNLREGKELGIKLKEIENTWLNNNFKISDDEIKNIVKIKNI